MNSPTIKQPAVLNRAFLKRQRLPTLEKPAPKTAEPSPVAPEPPKTFYDLAYYWVMSRG